MVDSIGAKVIAGAPRVTPVARAKPVGPIDTAASGVATPSTAAVAQTLSATMASTAPVDADRVMQIKNALANGTFPILPATIADQMLAFRYDWIKNDAA